MPEKKKPADGEEQDKGAPNADAEKIIKDHVMFSLLAGAIPIPVVDIVAVTAVQMDMLKALAKLYGADFNEERGKSLAGSITGAVVGNMLGRAGASALKAIPGIGTILGIGSQVVFAGASTYALGRVFDNHFAGKGNLINIDLEEMKKQFETFFQKGKDVAKNLQERLRKDDAFAMIEKLKKLKDSGAITEEEFEKTKKELLEKMTR